MTQDNPSTRKAREAEPFQYAGETIAPGESRGLELLCARLPTFTPLSIPVKVVHGRRPGPCVWVSAALHGDELNGVEIIRRVLATVSPRDLRGTILALPIVNVFGFVHQSRYLPDGRDLNRSFPGSERGSLAARIAALFVREVVRRATYGIDLHTGARHRTNLPQIRANLEDDTTRACAEAFGAPLILHSRTRDKSLREAAAHLGVPVLVYEAGEAQRFDDSAIRIGTRGVLQVLAHLKMINPSGRKQRCEATARQSTWVRAPRGGILRLDATLGQWLEKRHLIGRIADAFNEEGSDVRAPHSGLIIGNALNPLVHQGDAIVHITKDVTSPPPRRHPG